MPLCKFTAVQGDKVYVNTENILFVRDHNSAGCRIYMVGGGDGSNTVVTVKENLEDVVRDVLQMQA